MPDLILRQNLCEPTFTLNLVLRGVVEATNEESTAALIYWRWEDDPTMAPQPLGQALAGKSLTVDFDLKGKAIRLFNISKSKTGKLSVKDMKQAEQLVFMLTLPVLADATFDTGTDDVTLTIANNGGTGNIQILRQLGSDDFVQIDEVSPSTTNYTDSPTIDGTYTYKLTQTGQDGESNSRSVVASTIGAGAGTTPDTLAGDWDGFDSVDLTWTNHGGTGDVIVEKKTHFSSWFTTATLTSADTSYEDTAILQDPEFSYTYQYRVRNTSATGYSNTISVYVPTS
jgi:hypothetical protein